MRAHYRRTLGVIAAALMIVTAPAYSGPKEKAPAGASNAQTTDLRPAMTAMTWNESSAVPTSTKVDLPADPVAAAAIVNNGINSIAQIHPTKLASLKIELEKVKRGEENVFSAHAAAAHPPTNQEPSYDFHAHHTNPFRAATNMPAGALSGLIAVEDIPGAANFEGHVFEDKARGRKSKKIHLKTRAELEDDKQKKVKHRPYVPLIIFAESTNEGKTFARFAPFVTKENLTETACGQKDATGPYYHGATNADSAFAYKQLSNGDFEIKCHEDLIKTYDFPHLPVDFFELQAMVLQFLVKEADEGRLDLALAADENGLVDVEMFMGLSVFGGEMVPAFLGIGDQFGNYYRSAITAAGYVFDGALAMPVGGFDLVRGGTGVNFGDVLNHERGHILGFNHNFIWGHGGEDAANVFFQAFTDGPAATLKTQPIDGSGLHSFMGYNANTAGTFQGWLQHDPLAAVLTPLERDMIGWGQGTTYGLAGSDSSGALLKPNKSKQMTLVDRSVVVPGVDEESRKTGFGNILRVDLPRQTYEVFGTPPGVTSPVSFFSGVGILQSRVLEREITGGENLQFWAKWNLNSVDVIQHVHVQISQDNGVTYQSLPAYKVGNSSQLLTSTAVDPLFAPLAAFVTANRPDLNLDIGAPAFVLNSGGEWVHAEVNLEAFDGQPLRLRILSNGSIIGEFDHFGLSAGISIADMRQGGTSLMPNSAVSSGAGKRSITLAASRSRGWRGLKDMDPCTETGWVLMESGRFNCAHRMVEALNSTRGPGAIAAGQGAVLKAATADRDVLQRAPFKYDGGVITQYFNPSYHRLVPNVRFEPANQKGTRRWPNTLDLDPSSLWLTYINDPFVLPFLCLVDASCVPDDFVAMEGVAKAMVDPGPGFDLAVTDQLAFIRAETFNQPNYRPQMFLSPKANVLGLAGLPPIWPRGTVQPDTFKYAGWLTQISDDVISTANSPFYGTPDGVRTNTTPPVDTFSDVTNQQIPYRQAFTAEFLPKAQLAYKDNNFAEQLVQERVYLYWYRALKILSDTGFFDDPVTPEFEVLTVPDIEDLAGLLGPFTVNQGRPHPVLDPVGFEAFKSAHAQSFVEDLIRDSTPMNPYAAAAENGAQNNGPYGLEFKVESMNDNNGIPRAKMKVSLTPPPAL